MAINKFKHEIMPFNHRGCIVTPLVIGYEVFGKKGKNDKEIDRIIDKGLISLQNSIYDSNKINTPK
jgi:hypothetical protein